MKTESQKRKSQINILKEIKVGVVAKALQNTGLAPGDASDEEWGQ
jgi:hypothetical protein